MIVRRFSILKWLNELAFNWNGVQEENLNSVCQLYVMYDPARELWQHLMHKVYVSNIIQYLHK